MTKCKSTCHYSPHAYLLYNSHTCTIKDIWQPLWFNYLHSWLAKPLSLSVWLWLFESRNEFEKFLNVCKFSFYKTCSISTRKINNFPNWKIKWGHVRGRGSFTRTANAQSHKNPNPMTFTSRNIWKKILCHVKSWLDTETKKGQRMNLNQRVDKEDHTSVQGSLHWSALLTAVFNKCCFSC